MKRSIFGAVSAMASLLALFEGGASMPRYDDAARGIAFRPRNGRERWRRQVRAGRVVRHRR